jgi:hypothetical protein
VRLFVLALIELARQLETEHEADHSTVDEVIEPASEQAPETRDD